MSHTPTPLDHGHKDVAGYYDGILLSDDDLKSRSGIKSQFFDDLPQSASNTPVTPSKGR